MMLGDFLKAAAADRGPWNCSTLPADWCVALGHSDFAAQWRGTVEEADCEDAAIEGGGLVRLWDQGIGSALPIAAEAQPGGSLHAGGLKPGDIAVVALGETEAGAIWTGQRLALRAARGLHFVEPEALRIVKAWRP